MAVERRLQLLAAFADDHHAAVGAHALHGCQQMHQHRPASDRMKHLVGIGAHSRALARGENDDREFRLVHGCRPYTPEADFP